jgi:hypothetical protein
METITIEEEMENDLYKENLVFLQVRAHLLPLISLLEIVRLIEEHHEDKLTNILGSIRVPHSPQTKSKEKVFPTMKNTASHWRNGESTRAY